MNGMETNEDEHNFSDDDLDGLPDATLRELEYNAALSTQRERSNDSDQRNLAVSIQAPRRYAAHQVGEHASRNALSHSLNQNVYQRTNGIAYDEDEEFEWIGDDGVDTPIDELTSFIAEQRFPGEMTQREKWRQQRYGYADNLQDSETALSNLQQGSPRQQTHAVPRNEPEIPADLDEEIEMEMDQELYGRPSVEAFGHSAMQDRLRILMEEQERLKRELQDAKTRVITQQGEIAIIRENKNKESKQFDRQFSILKKSMLEESSKHKAGLQSMIEEHQRVISQNQFLKHELAEETEKTKSLQHKLKEKQPTHTTGSSVTPRKIAGNSLRDGFDDDEIMIVSPARADRRSKPSTPTVGSKRKRKTDIQSPIRPLALRHSDTNSNNREIAADGSHSKTERIVPIFRRNRRAERNLILIQKVLNYRLGNDRLQLTEAFMQFSFPTESKQTFSSKILEGVALLNGDRIPADLLQIFLELWSRCLKERYYKCVSLLIEVVNYIIDLDMSLVDNGIISSVLSVLQASGTINAAKRFEYSPVNQSTFGQFRQTPQSSLNQEVNGTACLKLLYKLACIIEDQPSLLDFFWRSMNTDFILMMLNAWQPVTDISLMLRLLTLSILPQTFGNIFDESEQQIQMEVYIIERVCYLLWETPKVDEGLTPLTVNEICLLRLEAMNLLTALAVESSPPPHHDPDNHGSQIIANHPSAIARIVRSLYDEVSAMSQMTSSHELHSELVNRGIRLLFHILQVHGDEIDLQKKLAAVNGGVHKHRVALTRLAFSDGFYLDRLITDETVAMATTMLEESVTPDEADQLIEMFPNFKGRRATQD